MTNFLATVNSGIFASTLAVDYALRHLRKMPSMSNSVLQNTKYLRLFAMLFAYVSSEIVSRHIAGLGKSLNRLNGNTAHPDKPTQHVTRSTFQDSSKGFSLFAGNPNPQTSVQSAGGFYQPAVTQFNYTPGSFQSIA